MVSSFWSSNFFISCTNGTTSSGPPNLNAFMWSSSDYIIARWWKCNGLSSTGSDNSEQIAISCSPQSHRFTIFCSEELATKCCIDDWSGMASFLSMFSLQFCKCVRGFHMSRLLDPRSCFFHCNVVNFLEPGCKMCSSASSQSDESVGLQNLLAPFG